MRTKPTFRDKMRLRWMGLPVRPAEAERTLALLGDLRRIGWHDAFTDGPRLNGEPTPWLNYAALFWLQSLTRRPRTVFEYGSGHSTLWWAARADRVVSIEHHQGWYERVRTQAPENVEVRFHPDDQSYPSAIRQAGGPFEVVTIDGGPDRNACIPHAIQYLTSDGLVIFDDTHLAYHAEGLRVFHEAGFSRIDFVGPAPGHRFIAATSVLSQHMESWLPRSGTPAFRTWF